MAKKTTETVEKKQREYSMSEKAVYMRNLRAKRALNKKPSYISPDFTDKLFDIEWEKGPNGRKKRNGKIISKTLNKEKAEDLAFKLMYQFRIYNKTTMVYWTDKGEQVTVTAAKNRKKLAYDIYNGNIDLSRGIYATQYYKKIINRNDVEFYNKSDVGIYLTIKYFLTKGVDKGKSRMVRLTLKNGTTTNVFVDKLYSYKDKIDYDKPQIILDTKPRNFSRPSFNSKIGGYWLPLGQISGEEKVRRFELNKKVEKRIKNSVKVLDGAENRIEARYFLIPENTEDNKKLILAAHELVRKRTGYSVKMPVFNSSVQSRENTVFSHKNYEERATQTTLHLSKNIKLESYVIDEFDNPFVHKWLNRFGAYDIARIQDEINGFKVVRALFHRYARWFKDMSPANMSEYVRYCFSGSTRFRRDAGGYCDSASVPDIKTSIGAAQYIIGVLYGGKKVKIQSPIKDISELRGRPFEERDVCIVHDDLYKFIAETQKPGFKFPKLSRREAKEVFHQYCERIRCKEQGIEYNEPEEKLSIYSAQSTAEIWYQHNYEIGQAKKSFLWKDRIKNGKYVSEEEEKEQIEYSKKMKEIERKKEAEKIYDLSEEVIKSGLFKFKSNTNKILYCNILGTTNSDKNKPIATIYYDQSNSNLVYQSKYCTMSSREPIEKMLRLIEKYKKDISDSMSFYIDEEDDKNSLIIDDLEKLKDRYPDLDIIPIDEKVEMLEDNFSEIEDEVIPQFKAESSIEEDEKIVEPCKPDKIYEIPKNLNLEKFICKSSDNRRLYVYIQGHPELGGSVPQYSIYFDMETQEFCSNCRGNITRTKTSLGLLCTGPVFFSRMIAKAFNECKEDYAIAKSEGFNARLISGVKNLKNAFPGLDLELMDFNNEGERYEKL